MNRTPITTSPHAPTLVVIRTKEKPDYIATDDGMKPFPGSPTRGFVAVYMANAEGGPEELLLEREISKDEHDRIDAALRKRSRIQTALHGIDAALSARLADAGLELDARHVRAWIQDVELTLERFSTLEAP